VIASVFDLLIFGTFKGYLVLKVWRIYYENKVASSGE